VDIDRPDVAAIPRSPGEIVEIVARPGPPVGRDDEATG
jgi:hypothetical protein